MMLPEKIRHFMKSLCADTESGLLRWHYDDDASRVELDTEDFHLAILYRFDPVEEVGAFRITYLNKTDEREYFFGTNQNYADFELVSALYDSAQSSDMELPVLGGLYAQHG
ncbi:hypothetical protein U5801_24815 [Lamprobacter modestohalophilus]|uniref:hypothetical protein n=1 Tax=Lamprobacter modestohalophilus TaxID=1064514 RepID=UPI002ADEF967|nr:hypothetical protein [Lamprobacter modestohalophilus]MEA1053005.1 hypothetical protein [Lamprobacter modestohalophilus]